MNKPRTIEGRWWIFGADTPPHYGVLNFDPEKGLELLVKIPVDRSTSDIFDILCKRGTSLPETIQGADRNNEPITLFGCTTTNSFGCGLDEYRIFCLSALVGHKYSSWSEVSSRIAKVEYSLLHRWMGRRHTKPMRKKKGLPAIQFNRWPILITKLSPDLTIRLESVSLPNGTQDEYKCEFTHRIWFVFRKKMSVGTIFEDYASVFLRLLSLLTGEPVFIDEFELFDRNPYGRSKKRQPLSRVELLRCCNGISSAVRNKSSHLMVASYDDIRADYHHVLKRWFELHETLEPVVELFTQVRRGAAGTITNRFLFLAQALEVYHARSSRFSSRVFPKSMHTARVHSIVQSAPNEHREWLKDKLAFSNQKTLAQRLDEIFAQFPIETKRLAAGIADFSEKVRHTRNYYTHYSEELRVKGKIAEGNEMIRLTFALEGLIGVCLLKDLGIQGKPITQILKRYTDMEITHLPDDSKHKIDTKKMKASEVARQSSLA